MAGAQGRKRGASSSESSGRGGKKGRASSSGKSSGKGGDALQKKRDAALHEASRQSIACKQSKISDVKSVTWRLKTDQNGNVRSINQENKFQSAYDGLKEVLDGRRKFFEDVKSMSILGVPVTQPSPSDETYSMVQIELDGKVVLWLLFRHSDGYFIAFYIVPSDENPGGWYHFSDASLPFGLEGAKLSWDSGYTKQVGVNIGKGTTLRLLECVLAFTPDNCHLQTFTPGKSTGDGLYDREEVLQTFMILFGECQRSGVFLQFAKDNFEKEVSVPVNDEMNEHLHTWSGLGRSVLAVYVALLYKKYGLHSWTDLWRYAVDRMDASVTALSTKPGHALIRNYIVYEPDENGNMVANYARSMTRLVGSGPENLLHLIKYEPDTVIDILVTMMKHGRSYSEVDVREV